MAQSRYGNLSEYIGLSAQCSKAAESPEHLANPLFNIANCTSKSELIYPDLIGQKTLAWRFFDSILGAAFVLFRSFLYFPNRIRLRDKIEQIDVLIVSHLTNLEHLSSTNDFYFENLASKLSDSGITNHTCLINHIEAKSNEVLQNAERTVLPAYLSPVRELIHISKLVLSIGSISSLKSNEATKRFSVIAKLAQFNSKAMGDYRIGSMLSDIITKSKPKLVVHTYEGHGWEKILNTKTRKTAEPPFICGYQHAALFPGPKSICFGSKDTSPMHIFTTGNITRDALKRDCEMPNISFSILGSNKNKGQSVKNVSQSTRGICLFAPEGTMGEVRMMAEIAVGSAIANPRQMFVLRLHPVLNEKKVHDELKELWPFPKNFQLSKNSLNDDLNNSAWICYRGSSVVFQAMLKRVKPIYLDIDGLAVYNDPLIGELDFKDIVSSSEQLNLILKRRAASEKIEHQKIVDAVSYAHNYMMPFSPDTFIDLFNAQNYD